ncbi:hypothetical protein GE09DRAFT_265946 [Coniochaeta sp. 2T2.1]|nr:hypothetical protein GE09DRAFT_265946 [Coniochaeta sp. 2T2.1]
MELSGGRLLRRRLENISDTARGLHKRSLSRLLHLRVQRRTGYSFVFFPTFPTHGVVCLLKAKDGGQHSSRSVKTLKNRPFALHRQTHNKNKTGADGPGMMPFRSGHDNFPLIIQTLSYSRVSITGPTFRRHWTPHSKHAQTNDCPSDSPSKSPTPRPYPSMIASP